MGFIDFMKKLGGVGKTVLDVMKGAVRIVEIFIDIPALIVLEFSQIVNPIKIETSFLDFMSNTSECDKNKKASRYALRAGTFAVGLGCWMMVPFSIVATFFAAYVAIIALYVCAGLALVTLIAQASHPRSSSPPPSFDSDYV